MIIMAKVTVKHYLNKELNPILKAGEASYPLYVQVIALQKNLKFKSNNNLFTYLTEKELSNELIISILSEEKKTIEFIVNDLIEKKKDNFITSKYINLFSKNLYDVIDENFSKLLIEEAKKNDVNIPSIIQNASFSDIVELTTFYNETQPLSNISENVNNTLNSALVIYDEIKHRIYYVYDLFGGSKNENIIYSLDSYTGYNKQETELLFDSLKNLILDY